MCPGRLLSCTTYGYLLGVAGGDFVNVWKKSQKLPCLSKELQNISSMKLLLGEKKASISEQKQTKTVKFLLFTLNFCQALCAYLFVLEGLHQLRHPTERHGEGQMGAAVAVGDLDTLVAKIAFPVCVTPYVILTKDVRYKVSWGGESGRSKRAEDQWGEISL